MNIGATPVRRWPALLCLCLVLIFPLLSAHMEQVTSGMAAMWGEIPARVASEGVIWTFGAVVLGIALLGEPRTLSSIGLRRPTIWTPLLGVGAAIALIALGGVASFVTYNVFHAPNHTPAQIEALVRGSLGYALLLALRGGVIEEVFYRGLAIEQLTEMIGNRGLAALIATLGFVAIHVVHFDLRQLIPIATASSGLALIYLWRRNLWINIIAHTIIDAVALGVVAIHATNLY